MLCLSPQYTGNWSSRFCVRHSHSCSLALKRRAILIWLTTPSCEPFWMLSHSSQHSAGVLISGKWLSSSYCYLSVSSMKTGFKLFFEWNVRRFAFVVVVTLLSELDVRKFFTCLLQIPQIECFWKRVRNHTLTTENDKVSLFQIESKADNSISKAFSVSVLSSHLPSLPLEAFKVFLPSSALFSISKVKVMFALSHSRLQTLYLFMND